MASIIYSSDGKKFPLKYLFKVTEKYLYQLPKSWNTEGLVIHINGSIYFACPDNVNGVTYSFIKCLDKGCKFKVRYEPKTILRNGGTK